MDNLHLSHLLQNLQIDTSRKESSARDHSLLAMRAARRMRSSKSKVKTGRTVCQHLLLMINEADSCQPDPRASRRFQNSVGEQGTERLSAGRLVGISDFFSAQAVNQTAANDRQFSLAF
ncbi:MAG: hypothetical protein ACJAYE_002928 [Candidatus Azotimanducaceae bacterium]|jgi:hypothetical protein